MSTLMVVGLVMCLIPVGVGCAHLAVHAGRVLRGMLGDPKERWFALGAICYVVGAVLLMLGSLLS